MTLRDTFEPAVSFEESTYVVAEGKSVTVRAVLSGPPGEDTDVPLTIVRGDGLTDEDFSGVPSSLFFAAGEMEASFVLAALPDQLDEEDEIIELRFFPKTVPAGEPALVTLRDTFEPDSREQRNRVAGEYVPGLGGTLAGIVTQTLGGRLAQPGLPRGDRLAIGGHEVRLAANDIDAAVGGHSPAPPMTRCRPGRIDSPCPLARPVTATARAVPAMLGNLGRGGRDGVLRR